MNALLAALHNARARSRTLDRTAARAGRRGAPNRYAVCLFVAAVASAVSTTASGATFDWSTVVNNGDPVPGSTRMFNSYSPPSVNARGMVVFRGRSRGGQGQGEPERGVYARNMSNAASVVVKIADVQTIVPQPNNAIYNGSSRPSTSFPPFRALGSMPTRSRRAGSHSRCGPICSMAQRRELVRPASMPPPMAPW